MTLDLNGWWNDDLDGSLWKEALFSSVQREFSILSHLAISLTIGKTLILPCISLSS